MFFFYLLFLCYFAANFYVFVSLRRLLGKGRWQWPVLFFLAAMVAAWLLRIGNNLGSATEALQTISFFWMGFLIFACYSFILFDGLHFLFRFGRIFLKSQPSALTRFILAPKRYLCLAFLCGLLLYTLGIHEALNPRIIQISLETEKLLPGAQPLRIVAVSDLHIGSIIGPQMLEGMAKTINSLDADILLFSGDIIDSDMSNRQRDAGILRLMKARYGKFAVSGNHEFYHGLDNFLTFMALAQIPVLRGEVVEVAGITIAGVDDERFGDEKSMPSTSVARVLDKASADSFVLLLKHKPRWEESSLGLFDFQFSGHTHAGQFWPQSVIVKRIYNIDQGLTSLLGKNGQSSHIFVSNGIGFWGPPIRFFAPPDILLLTLKPSKK